MHELYCLSCAGSWMYNADVDASVEAAVKAFKEHRCVPKEAVQAR